MEPLKELLMEVVMKFTVALLLLLTVAYLQAVNLTYDKVRSNLRGIKLYEKEEIEAAVEQFENNVIDTPGEGTLHFNLGNAYYRMGEYDRAINEYNRALRDKNFSKESNAWHNIGNSFFEQQKYKEALDMYRNAIITDKDNPDARYNYELAKMMLEAMQNQEQPQSGQSDKERQEMMPAEETDDQDGEDAEVVQQEEGDGGDDKKESDIDKQSDLQDAENMLRTLLSREKELLEEERERNRRELNLKGRFW